MKKLTAIVLTLSIIFSCSMLYSCGTVDSVDTAEPDDIYLSPYTLYSSPADSSEGTAGLSLQTTQFPEEWTKGVDKYIDEKAAKVFSADLFGQTYTYEYTSSLERTLLTSPVGNRTIHTYGNTLEGFLSVDAETKQVVKWSAQMPAPDVFDSIFQTDSNGDIIYTIEPEELKQKAENYAKKLVGEEQLSKYEYVHTNENRIYFYRMINGQKTNEYIHLWFQSDGVIAGFDMRNIGLYNDLDSFKFDEEKAKNLIKTQLNNHYKETKHGIESMDITVKMLPNGQMAYYYTVNVMYCIGEEQDENGETLYDWGGEIMNFTIPAE